MLRKTYISIFLLIIGSVYVYSQDITPPAPVTIRFVTVDPGTGNTIINWNPSSSVDVDIYSVYKLINDYKIFVAEVTHPNTSFTNLASPVNSTSSLAESQIETYYVSATDDAPPPGPNESELSSPHHSIFLQSVFRPCYGEVRLSWNDYDTWLSGIHSYDVYCKAGTGPWGIIGTLDSEMNSFIHYELVADEYYYYYVVANDGSGTLSSTSNMVSAYTNMDHPPAVLDANYASVESSNNISLQFTVDLSADVSSYKILRSESVDGDYNSIAVFDATTLTDNTIEYVDHAPTSIIHYYKMVAFNATCNVAFSKMSNIASNIVLTAESLDNLKNDLLWTNYFKWPMGISYYEVIRIVDANNPVIVGEIPYGDTTFFDKLDEYIYDPLYNPLDPLDEINQNEYLQQPVVSGKICYRVRAYEGDGATLGNYSSLSNTFCVTQEPRVFIPNAFSPNNDNLNDEFYPYVSFAGLYNYELSIFDQWGQLIYTTDHPHEPWDGTQISGDRMARSGAYVYLLKFENGEGKPYMYTGDVILIR